MIDHASFPDVLELLAMQEAAGSMWRGSHGSRLCLLKKGSWQAKVLRGSSRLPKAKTPAELRRAMKITAAPVVFLPCEAILTAEAIGRICTESSLDKTIVWERN